MRSTDIYGEEAIVPPTVRIVLFKILIAFRAAYRRERAVELMFENHRWWDIRRWMILEETFKDTYPIKGALFTPRESNHGSITDKSTLTYDYEQIYITPEVRSFTKKNYWYPLPQHDVDALNNLQQNPYW